MMLRVLARSGLVPNYGKLVDSIKTGVPLPHGQRFVAREFVADDSGASLGEFRPTSEPVEVVDCHEYRQHVAEGSLWPADEATAVRCGVKFDPTFGGALEHA